MKYLNTAAIFLCFVGLHAQDTSLKISAPEAPIRFEFNLDPEGKPYYMVFHKNEKVIDTSFLGFELRDAPALSGDFKLVNTKISSKNESWPMPWGEQLEVINHYNELLVQLEEKFGLKRKLNIRVRVFNDGLGFRYEFPKQENLNEVLITDENTQFQLMGNHDVWWQPGDWDIYEHLYNATKLSKINATSKRDHKDLAQTYIPENAVNTPVTMRTEKGLHLSFHEAALLDYSGITLKVDTTTFLMKSNLVGSENQNYKVKRSLPFFTPWRTIQISEKATQLIDSKLILNLNEPNKLGAIPWFKPMKYVGIWWEMHLGKSTWDMSGEQDMSTFTTQSRPHGKHGATTENAKYYIDFASRHGIRGVLIEGWNTGWERWIGFEDREGVFDFVTPYEDYDLEEVVRYAKERDVELMMHHETSAAPRTYEKQLDTAYALMKKYDMHSVKSGYVGKIIPKGEYHHGQWMVNHYNNVAIKAAEYKIAVNAHEPIMATGLRRTYPNIISREGLRGQEFNAWASDGGNPPEHLPIVAFTRMLAGPIDYTPGIFNIKFDEYKEDNQVNTTLAQQLALYVVIYSPIQMVPDLPEHYEGQPAFQFIKDVAVDWKQTKVLNGEVGEFVTIAREDRNSNNWFLGSITNEEARDLDVKLDFLPAGNFKAIFYEDGEDAHWDKNPTAISIREQSVTNKDSIKLKLAAGGGVAISFEKLAE